MKLRQKLFILGLAGAFTGAIVVSWWRYEDLSQHPSVYRSLAKLLVLYPAEPILATRKENSDFYGTSIELIESGDMAGKAFRRLASANPRLRESSHAYVRAVRTKDSGLISVLATGNEAAFTQAYLDAVLDEFIASRQAAHDAHFGRLIGQLEMDAGEAEKALILARQAHNAAWGGKDSMVCRKEEQRLEGRLLKLRDQIDDLNLELKLSGSSGDKTSGAAKIQILKSESKTVGDALRSARTEIEALDASLRSLAEAERIRADALNRVAEARREFELFTDVVAVQERATEAEAFMPEPLEALAGAAFAGAVGGGCLIFCLAWILTLRPMPRGLVD